MPTAWSKLKLEASKIPIPFCMMRTRSASKPRIIGLDAFGPNCVAETPGILLSVSPSVPSRRKLSSRPFNTETGTTSSSEPTPNGLPVTATGAKSILVASSANAFIDSAHESAKNTGLTFKKG